MKREIKDQCNRCSWVTPGNTLYEEYHDNEWGVPVYDDIKLFEFLVLESAQAGLNFLTILKKRENYREAFAAFDPAIVAGFNETKIQELIKNPGIIRNRLKIRSSIHNAKCFLKIQKEFGSFSNYLWGFFNHKSKINHLTSHSDVPCHTEDSKALSGDLKKRGFQFIGPKIMYAYMQAVGIVNDHMVYCKAYQKPAKPWYVYIIESKAGALYTGITTDINRRFNEHTTRKKGARFFHISEPAEVAYIEQHPDRSSATQRELAIKKLTRNKKEQIISNYRKSKYLQINKKTIEDGKEEIYLY